MNTATPPVPNPAQPPKPADQMAREGEREGDVLIEGDHSQSAPEDSGNSPPPLLQAILNGD